VRGRNEECLAAELAERTHRIDCPLGSATLALEDETAHGRIDSREVSVQELLRVVGLCGDVRALAELQHCFECRRDVAAGPGNEEAIVLGSPERFAIELPEDVGRETGHIFALERPTCRDAARVAHRVAVAVLDRGRRDDHVVDVPRDRALGRARDEPRLAGESADRLVREPRLALVRDRDEHVRLGRRAEDDLERRRRPATGESGMERRAAAGEEEARFVRETLVAHPFGHLREPLGLHGNGSSGQLTGHGRLSIPSRDVAIFEKATLGNGVRVVTAPFPQVGSVSCFVMLSAGSRYETPASQGIAHFAEHMFFKGTERRPTARTISTEIDAIGGEFNAFTGKELTGYYVRCGSETRDVALDVLADMLLHSRFDEAEIEKEKGVILEEMNVYLDTPQRYVGNIYDRLLYADQPLGWDILGTRETIESTSRETFLSYLDTWYRPERMVVGIGGRIGDGLTERLEELLGGIEARPTGHAVEVALPPDTSPVLLHTKDSEQAHLIMGVRGYPIGHPNRYALQLLAVVLGGGMSSRLFTEVREKRGLGYYVNAGNAAYTDAGTFYSSAGVDVGRVDEAITTILGELRKIAAEPVPADELEKARGYAKGRFVLRLESPQGTIQYGLRKEVLEGEIEEPDELLGHLDQVTVEDVQRVAKDLFEGKRLYLALVGPFDDPAHFEKLLAA
jgi:predicted Zn-dependent peptidase